MIRAFFRLFFYLLYQPLAWTYDWVAAFVSAGLWQEWIGAILPDLDESPGRTLELGHGPGHLQVALARRGRAVFGLDRSAQMGRQAAGRLGRVGQPVRLARGQAQALPFRGAAFAQVFSTFPTEYVIHPDTLAEVWRVLVPGGRWIILPDAWVTGRSLPQRFSTLLFRLTGQSASLVSDEWLEPYLEHYRRAGFETRIERRRLRASVALVITATRRSGSIGEVG